MRARLEGVRLLLACVASCAIGATYATMWRPCITQPESVNGNRTRGLAEHALQTHTVAAQSPTASHDPPSPMMQLSNWPPLPNRNAIYPILEQLKLKAGIEVGVQKGRLALVTLRVWKSCQEYKLVDLWGKEDNYHEPGADSTATKDANLKQARRVLKKFDDITEFFVMRSTDASKLLEDGHFDYIYVDARHDYCAVMEDMDAYWPKLKPGGIMAGHDFVDAEYATNRLGAVEDWSKCEDGSLQPRAVRGAVEDFVAKHELPTLVSTQEDFPTWVIQKPRKPSV